MEEIIKRLDLLNDIKSEMKENNRELKEKYNELINEVKITHNALRKENENLK